MAFTKNLPLSERIKSICAEAEEIVAAKAAELKAQYDGLPISWIRRDLEHRTGPCVCKQAIAIIEEDGK
jgi:hypothetical protein